MATTSEDDEIIELIKEQLAILENSLDELEMSMLMDGEESSLDAIVEIHAGAGGVDAQDWAEMLLRMYLRWSEANGYKTEYLDYQAGDEAGVKSVTLNIAGPNAFGFLRGETGVHRLIRISPFDSSGRRHTSFA